MYLERTFLKEQVLVNVAPEYIFNTFGNPDFGTL